MNMHHLKFALAFAGALLLGAAPAIAQSNPGLTKGQVLTAGQWNALFAGKQDVLGYTPLNVAGGTMSGRLVTAAAGATTAGFNLTPGTTPASPADGDMWTTSAGLFVRINGVTTNLNIPPAATSIIVGTTVVSGGVDGRILIIDSGVLGQYSITGSGTVVAMANSPTLITPVIGAATATSINKVAITAPATGSTLTIADGKTLTVNNSFTFTGTDGTSFIFPGASDTVVTLGATQTLTAKTLTSPAIAGGALSGTFSGTPTLSGANFVTLANIVQNATAWSLLGNAGAGTANNAAFTIGALTNEPAPAGTDLLLLQKAAGGALRNVTVSSVAAGAAVASFNTLTGSVTFNVVPQGRLTLVTATPVMTSDQTAKSQIFYTGYVGTQVPYYTGSADAYENIPGGEVSLTMVSAASAGQVVSGQVYDVWYVQGGANRICIAMSASGGGGGGWASDTGGSATARGTGYSQISTARGYLTNTNSITNCFNGATNYGPVAANTGTYLGTIFATANGQTGMAFTPAAASGGGNNVLGLYNAYNRVPIKARNQDSNTTGVTLTGPTWAKVAASASNRVRYVDGLAQSSVIAEASNCSFNTTAGVAGTYMVGVSRDWSSGAPTNPNGNFYSGVTGRQDTACIVGRDVFLPLFGLHSIDAVEAGVAATSQARNAIFGGGVQNESLTVELNM